MRIYFLSDEKFLAKRVDQTIQIWYKTYSFVEFLLINVSGFSKNCDENRVKWIYLNVVEVLLQISKLKSSFKFNAYLTVAKIANDWQIENLIDMQWIVETNIKYLKELGPQMRQLRETRQKRLKNRQIKIRTIRLFILIMEIIKFIILQ